MAKQCLVHVEAGPWAYESCLRSSCPTQYQAGRLRDTTTFFLQIITRINTSKPAKLFRIALLATHASTRRTIDSSLNKELSVQLIGAQNAPCTDQSFAAREVACLDCLAVSTRIAIVLSPTDVSLRSRLPPTPFKVEYTYHRAIVYLRNIAASKPVLADSLFLSPYRFSLTLCRPDRSLLDQHPDSRHWGTAA